MQIDWMTPYFLRSTSWLFLFGAIVLIAAVGLLVQVIRQSSRADGRRRRPVVEQPKDPTATGPISISGLKLRMRLVYDRGPRRPRAVTLYAATGHCGPDGRIALELLHTVCHAQHAPRTFRVDRVIAATDVRGREIHDLSAWVLATVPPD